MASTSPKATSSNKISISAEPSPSVSVSTFISLLPSKIAVKPVLPIAEIPVWKFPDNNPSKKITSFSLKTSKSVIVSPAPAPESAVAIYCKISLSEPPVKVSFPVYPLRSLRLSHHPKNRLPIHRPTYHRRLNRSGYLHCHY
jgi:hypothetical protein